jgi:DNA-binding NtrC family response regulator
VLIIEDDPDGLRSAGEAVGEIGVDVECAATAAAGLAAFRSRPADAVLCDLVLPDLDGIEVLTRLRQADPAVPVIIMTAYGSVDSSVRAMKAGAYDYLTKPLDLDDVQSKVSRAIETRRLRSEVSELRHSLRARFTARAMVARSPAMQRVLRQIETLAATNATVMIAGESGTGKELVAKALHYDGRRSGGPFVAVNCGAFTETLLESELFGHEKGSFTGAIGQHRGAFERADGGTLFLDEVGDASRPVQVKLLRALEEREIMRLGGQQPFKVDVRVISATNRELSELVRRGEFREDLLYRLRVVCIDLPPLRERREDIRPLAERFMAAACEEHGRSVAAVDPGFYAALEGHAWPGNVRELKNVVEEAVVMNPGADLTAATLRLPGAAEGAAGQGAGLAIPPGMTLAEIEKEALIRQLRLHGGNRTLAAEALGLSRRTVQRKIKERGLPY